MMKIRGTSGGKCANECGADLEACAQPLKSSSEAAIGKPGLDPEHKIIA